MTSDAAEPAPSTASPASPESPDSPASPTSPASADSPASPDEVTADSEGDEEFAELAAAEPVDTEPLERAQQAIDEGREAAAEALDPPPDDEDLDFRNTETNDDPEASDNAVPRPN